MPRPVKKSLASLFAYTAKQPRAGARRGRTGRQAVSPWLAAFPGGCRRKQHPRAGRPTPATPHGAGWEAWRLTYWKGRRTARRSPLKKRVMSSTKSTPWQDVKSNCRGGTGVSGRGPQACTGRPGVPGGPGWAVCWPEGRGFGSRPPSHAHPRTRCSSPCHPRRPPQTLRVPFTSPSWGIQACSPPPPPPTNLPQPEGPRADLGLEAKHGDREADEGRDAQAQQHGCGVVVAAGRAGQGVGFRAGLLVSPCPPPRSSPSART